APRASPACAAPLSSPCPFRRACTLLSGKGDRWLLLVDPSAGLAQCHVRGIDVEVGTVIGCDAIRGAGRAPIRCATFVSYQRCSKGCQDILSGIDSNLTIEPDRVGGMREPIDEFPSRLRDGPEISTQAFSTATGSDCLSD